MKPLNRLLLRHAKRLQYGTLRLEQPQERDPKLDTIDQDTRRRSLNQQSEGPTAKVRSALFFSKATIDVVPYAEAQSPYDIGTWTLRTCKVK